MRRISTIAAPQSNSAPGRLFAQPPQGLRSFSKWIIYVFASPIGIPILPTLDSTLFFSMPFGIDGAVVILAARMDELWWVVPLLATAGSVAGAALTFWMGQKIGEHGLERYIQARRLDRV